MNVFRKKSLLAPAFAAMFYLVMAFVFVGCPTEVETGTDIISFTVTFHANEGTGAVPAAITAKAGSSIMLPAAGDLEKSGHTFGGWNESADGGGTNYSAGSSYDVTKNIILYAKWNAVQTGPCIVTFDGNGNTSISGSVPVAVEVSAGGNVTLPFPPMLAKTGYTFDGWNTKADGTGDQYAAPSTYTVNVSITFFARWIPISYKVVYNKNHAAATGEMEDSEHDYGTAKNLNPNKFVYGGHLFNGWTAAAEGTGTVYADKEPVLNLRTTAGNFNLYAKWIVDDASPVYQINLDPSSTFALPNLGVGYTTAPSSTVTVINAGNRPTGLLNLSLTGTHADSFTLGQATITDIAVDAEETITITPVDSLTTGTYTAMLNVTGSNSINATLNISVIVEVATFGIELTDVIWTKPITALVTAGRYDDLYNTTTNTFTFPTVTHGSGSTEGYSGNRMDFGITLTNNGNQSTGPLTIRFTGVNASSFEVRLGNSVTSTYTVTNIPAGESLTVGGTNNNGFRHGSGLAVGTFTAVLSITGDNGLNASVNISYTVLPLMYTVTFNANTTDTVTNLPSPLTDVPGPGISTIVKPSPNPGRAGYDFVDWYKEAACTNAWNFDTEMVIANTTLYAKWEIQITAGSHSVNFNSNGGSDVPAQSVEDGEKAVEPPNPTKGDMVFQGWFTDNVTFLDDWDFDANAVNGSITLYAKWADPDVLTNNYYDKTGNPTGSLIFKWQYVVDGWFNDPNTGENILPVNTATNGGHYLRRSNPQELRGITISSYRNNRDLFEEPERGGFRLGLKGNNAVNGNAADPNGASTGSNDSPRLIIGARMPNNSDSNGTSLGVDTSWNGGVGQLDLDKTDKVVKVTIGYSYYSMTAGYGLRVMVNNNSNGTGTTNSMVQTTIPHYSASALGGVFGLFNNASNGSTNSSEFPVISSGATTATGPGKLYVYIDPANVTSGRETMKNAYISFFINAGGSAADTDKYMVISSIRVEYVDSVPSTWPSATYTE